MQITAALRERARLAALLPQVEQAAQQKGRGGSRDRRTQRTWRPLILGALVARSLRLLALGRAVAAQRRAHSVKAVAQGLASCSKEAPFGAAAVSTRWLEEALRHLDPEAVETYRGAALVVLDPTEYEKRSRGRGKCGRQMEHIGRVRRPKTAAQRKKKGASAPGAEPTPRVVTTYGYVDIWAGLVLRDQQSFPLARQLFSRRHPQATSQNAVEEAVLGQAVALLGRVGWPAIVLGDRGVGRKELLIRLAQREQGAVLRVDADITVYPDAAPQGLLLADALAQQPWRTEVEWDRGEQGRLRGRERTLRAAIRFSRTGRKDDVQEATLPFVEAVPLDGTTESLVLATTLAVDTPAQARALVRLYARRWAIETAVATMHARGQDRFMVRSWVAIERLLWVLALADALVVLALHHPRLQRLRAQAVAVLRQLSVVADQLTLGKLVEAIGLDFARHSRAWLNVWGV